MLYIMALYAFQVGGAWRPLNYLYGHGVCRAFRPTNLESIKSQMKYLRI
jgi:hypothetical protein